MRSYTLKEFAALMFEKCPGLEPFKKSLNEIFQAFNAYKQTIPVRGAIMLDPRMEKCLLVRGYRKEASWGFPKGKLSKDETDDQCAVREVLEETGLDISDKLDPAQYIDVKLGGQDTRLFIVPNVDDTTEFAPHVKGEIGAYAWHLIQNLPATYQDGKLVFFSGTGEKYRFFNVWPYMKQLKAWIAKSKRKQTENPLLHFSFNKKQILQQLNLSN